MDDGGDLPPMPEASDGLAEPIDPLQGQSHPEPDPDGLVEDSMRTAFDVWHRLVEDATNVGVKNLTFTEVISSRCVKDVLPAVARIYARLRYLRLPLHPVKRAVRTLISAKLCPLESWPVALRHIGERRLRCQLQGIGWPAAPLLKFGTTAFALKKSWQDLPMA